MERYRDMEALNFVSAEIHKQIGALFNPNMTAEMKQVQLGVIERRLNALETRGKAVPGRRQVLRGRCLSLHRAQLDKDSQD
jgi:hypothetical protein